MKGLFGVHNAEFLFQAVLVFVLGLDDVNLYLFVEGVDSSPVLTLKSLVLFPQAVFNVVGDPGFGVGISPVSSDGDRA